MTKTFTDDVTSENEATRTSPIGELPADWRVTQIGELFDIKQGKALSRTTRVGPSQRPFLRTANVLWGRVDLEIVDRMHFSDAEAERLSLRPGDLLVCEGGEIGRSALWKLPKSDYSFQNHLHRLRGKSDAMDPEFVMYWLQAAFLHLDVYGGVGNRTTIPNLSASRVKQLDVPQPPLQEQRAIASVLSKLQARVEVQDRIFATLEGLKAATMAKLFREGVRGEPLKQTQIGDLPESWDVVPLGTVLDVAQYGLSIRGAKTGRYPILRMNCQEAGEVVFRDLQFVDLETATFEKYRLNPGDILFNRTNSYELVGRSAMVEDPRPAVFASYLLRLTTNESKLLPAVLNDYFTLPLVQDALKGLATRAVGQSNISASRLRLLPVPLPPLTEQHELADISRELSSAVRLDRSRTELLSRTFDGVLKLLMTGQVRVTPALARGAKGHA